MKAAIPRGVCREPWRSAVTGAALLAGLSLVLIVVLAVVVFYGVRLAKASRQAAGSADRLREFMRNQQAAAQWGVDRLSNTGPGSAGQAVPLASRPVVSSTAEGPGDVVISDVRVGLADVADAPVYLSRDQQGTVLVQMGAKPLAPLSYVLEPRVHHALRVVADRATAKFGQAWSILAWDDPQGGLMLRRLS